MLAPAAVVAIAEPKPIAFDGAFVAPNREELLAAGADNVKPEVAGFAPNKPLPKWKNKECKSSK